MTFDIIMFSESSIYFYTTYDRIFADYIIPISLNSYCNISLKTGVPLDFMQSKNTFIDIKNICKFMNILNELVIIHQDIVAIKILAKEDIFNIISLIYNLLYNQYLRNKDFIPRIPFIEEARNLVYTTAYRANSWYKDR